MIQIVLISIYQDEIKQYALEYINQNEVVEVSVGEIGDLSVFADFPNISLNLENLGVLPYEPNESPLDSARISELHISFDLFNLILGNTTVRALDARTMKISITQGKTQQASSLKWTDYLKYFPKKIGVTDLDFEYQDPANNFSLRNTHANLNVNVDDSEVLVDINTTLEQLLLENYSVEKVPVLLKAVYKNNQWDFKKILIHELFAVAQLNQLNNDWAFNLDLESSLNDLKPILPKNWNKLIDDLDISSKLNGNIEITSNDEVLSYQVNYTASKAKLFHKSIKGSIENIICAGSYVNKNGQEKLLIQSFNGDWRNSKLKSKGVLDFKTKSCDMSINGDLKAEDLNDFVKDRIKLNGGIIKVNTAFSRNVRKWSELFSEELADYFSDMTLNIAQVSFEYNKLDVQDLSGVVKPNLKKGKYLADVSFKYQGASHKAKTDLIWKKKLKGDIHLTSTSLDFDQFQQDFQSSSSNSDFDYDMLLTYDIGDGVFMKELYHDISGKVALNPNKVHVKNLKAKALSGSLSCSVLLKTLNNQKDYDISFDIQKIDGKEMFQLFNNFDQEYVTAENIGGKISSSGRLRYTTVDEKINPKTVVASFDVSVEEGRLEKVKILSELVAELKQNKLYRIKLDFDRLEKEIENIAFSEFSSSIDVRNNCVSISNTSLKNSALDINL
ncbi:MAG: hypothetical protein MRY83_10245, partial [Flavobacteriales bacterium]|nr:hypothetical protein [Flavobacteriales bacterium]